MHTGKPIPLPPQAVLQESFVYDALSGVLTWKVRPLAHFKNAHGMNTFNAKHAGTIAGHRCPRGYLSIRIFDRSFLAHRLIWKMVTGQDPVAEIDHRNEDKSCNVWTNLREATHQQNTINRGPTSRSTTGVKGVSWDRNRNRYAAFINKGGKSTFLGRFDSIENASAAYRAAERSTHGEFSHA